VLLQVACEDSPLGTVPDTGEGPRIGAVDAGISSPDAGFPPTDGGEAADAADASAPADAAPAADVQSPDAGSADASAPDAAEPVDAGFFPDAQAFPDASAPDAAAPDAEPADSGLPPGPNALFAVHPSVARTGATIALEGVFDPSSTAVFPGGVTATISTFGTSRAIVTVPGAATEGELTVVTAGRSTSGLPFRRSSFEPGLHAMSRHFEQVAYARQMPRLNTARRDALAIVLGPYLYVLGGHDGAQPQTSVERARIAADGALGAFEIVNGANLSIARSAAAIARVGRYVYVAGGDAGGGPLNSVERAPVAADGTIGTFIVVAGLQLVEPRTRFSLEVIGDQLLAIGGASTSGPVASIEAAVIHLDGTLDPFVTTAARLGTARAGASTAVIGDRLFVAAGTGPSGLLASVESSAIGPSGALLGFSDEAAALSTARSDSSAVVLGNQLTLIGGQSATGATPLIETAVAGPRLSPFGSAPGLALRYARQGAAVAIAANELWVIGGASTAGGQPIPSLERATINGGSGQLILTPSSNSLTIGRGHAAIAVVADRLYLIGGYANSTILTSIEVADIGPSGALGSFTTASSRLVESRMNARVVIVEDLLYVIGGRGGAQQGPLSSVEVASIARDGSLGPFSLVPGLNLVEARSGHGAVVLERSLYIFGGYGNGTNFFDTVERAELSRATIGAFQNYPMRLAVARDGFVNAVVGETLMLVAGRAGIIIDILGAISGVEQANVTAGGDLGPFSVNANLALPVPRSEPSGFMTGGRLFVAGGFGGNPPRYVTEIDALDLSSAQNNFAALSPMPSGRARQQSIALKNWAYVLGGDVSRAPASSIVAGELH